MRRRLSLRLTFVLSLALGCGDDNRDDDASAERTCPTHLTIALDGSAGDLDFGSTGVTHDATMPATSFTVGLACDGAADCSSCAITGLITATDLMEHGRCSGAIDRVCTRDAECSLGRCDLYLTAPIPLSAGGAPACVLNRLTEPVTGSFGPATGTLDTTLRVAWAFYGARELDRPCPTCTDDGSGTARCVGGERDGMHCAIQARSVLGDTSLDCLPSESGRFSDIPIALDLTTGARTLSGTAACAAGGGLCHCEGQTSPNDCTDGVCVVEADGEGICPSGPIDHYCAIETFRPCGSDAQCPAAGDSCTASMRECAGAVSALGDAPDPLTRLGTNHATAPVLASVACLPRSVSALQNQALGMPGPFALRVPATFCTTDTCDR